MKPLYLKMAAFGPYKDCQEIDFAQLGEKGLFLICGETGSGKTMILDAITFALYGKSSGNMRDDLEALRCRFCDWGQDTYVEFTFSVRGEYYRFERRLECKRKNLTTSQNAYRKNEEGVWVPLFENCKKGDMDALAVQLIGLDYDQFRQVIILPQGQFEKLLTSNSDEKERILMQIFGVDKWQKIAEHFYHNADRCLQELKGQRELMNHGLQEEGCENLEQLREQIQQLEQQQTALEEEFRELDYENRQKQLEYQKELLDRFEHLDNLREQLEEHRLHEGEQGQRLEKRELAVKAQRIAPFLQAYENAEMRKKQACKRIEECETNYQEAREQMLKVKQCMEAYEARAEEMEQLAGELPLYRQKESSYQQLGEVRRELSQKKETWGKEQQELQELQKKQEKLQEQSKSLRITYEELTAKHQELFRAYVADVAGVLAEELEDGAPCPVCGSTSHPRKTERKESEITKQQVEACKAEGEAVYRQLSEVLEALTGYGNQTRQQEEKCLNLQYGVQNMEQEQARLEEQLIPGVDTPEKFKKWLVDLSRQLEQYQTELAEVKQTELACREKMSVAFSHRELAEKELGNAKAICQEKLEALEEQLQAQEFSEKQQAVEAMLSPEELSALSSTIEKYIAEGALLEQQIHALEKQLGRQKRPDRAWWEQSRRRLEEQKEAYLTGREALRVLSKQKQDKLARLEETYAQLEQKWTGAETDWAFAKTLRGDTGMGMQRYVLGILFSSVIVAANRMLEQVHGGRYRLYRSDERAKGSNKRGLELKVYDSFSGEQEGRSVKTLSGGEKFLVSLALSIGMSSVAGRSGIRIEAMFVDEGFGSLDRNSIEDALNILAGIQKQSGMVGIISHVQLLQDHIPTKLQIEKSRDGSQIVSNVG